jgi:dTDP-4-dehydrorhamnose 3,5-epimerase-like enzyme
MNFDKPRLIEGSLAVDDRGEVRFVNEFNPDDYNIRRLYFTSNHCAGAVRAWHGHKYESKCVMAATGSALVCTVPLDGSENDVEQFVLSASKPAVLAIPSGYVNGWKSLTSDCRLLWFSSNTLADSREDDIRFDARKWNPWETIER